MYFICLLFCIATSEITRKTILCVQHGWPLSRLCCCLVWPELTSASPGVTRPRRPGQTSSWPAARPWQLWTHSSGRTAITADHWHSQHMLKKDLYCTEESQMSSLLFGGQYLFNGLPHYKSVPAAWWKHRFSRKYINNRHFRGKDDHWVAFFFSACLIKSSQVLLNPTSFYCSPRCCCKGYDSLMVLPELGTRVNASIWSTGKQIDAWYIVRNSKQMTLGWINWNLIKFTDKIDS